MQNIISGVNPSGSPNGNQLLSLCDPGNLFNIRPIGSNSILSPISSKMSTKQTTPINCSVVSSMPIGQNNDGSAGDGQGTGIRSLSPSHSSPSINNQQTHIISSSSSSSESGVRIDFI